MSVSILNQIFPTRQLVLASNNQGKLAEFKQLFEQANLEITVIPQGQLGILDAQLPLWDDCYLTRAIGHRGCG